MWTPGPSRAQGVAEAPKARRTARRLARFDPTNLLGLAGALGSIHMS